MNMHELTEEKTKKEEQIKKLQGDLEEIDDSIFELVKDQAKSQGTTTIEKDGVKLSITIPMRTSWDESKLKQIAEQIKDHGDDPSQYINFKPQVSEKSYKAWPEAIRRVFEPARTVKPGKRKIEVK